MLGLTMTAVIGFAGLALDLGRLYVNKSELQTAADACALAAAAELCGASGTAACLQNAEAAGQFAAARNRNDFQKNGVAIAAADVEFSANFTVGYGSRATAAVNSTFARCTARANGITPWFMGVLGIGAQAVNARAVAGLAKGRQVCPNAPIGICPPTAAATPYAVGDWIVANATTNGNGGTNLSNPKGNYGASVKGTYRWIDYDPNAGGTNEVSDRLVGSNLACGITLGSTVNEEGNKQGTKDAYNTRFGIYANGANAYSVATAPPDRTGFSYPTTATYVPAIAVGTSAYADYRSHQASGDPFQGTGSKSTYSPQGQGNQNINGNASSSADHLAFGTNDRLITAPIINGCTGVTHAVTVQSFGCFLMLNPMANGQNGDTFLEYRGDASAAGSPCASAGAPGGPGSGAGSVPTLVQ